MDPGSLTFLTKSDPRFRGGLIWRKVASGMTGELKAGELKAGELKATNLSSTTLAD